VIQSFACPDTQAFFEGRPCPRFRNIRKVLERKLQMLDGAQVIGDLKAPPNNRLEKLKGALAGSYSIRVNGQYRLVFRWTQEGPADARCTDYH
jgi:proteic killer suppression protein